MCRPIWKTALLAGLAATVGCGGSAEDKLVAEHLAAYNQLADVYDSVTDPASHNAVESKIGALKKQLVEQDKKLSDLGTERKEAALRKRAIELAQAKKKLSDAYKKAGKAVGAKTP